VLTEVLRAYQAALGPDDHEVGVTLHNLGSLEYRAGDPAAAAGTLREALAVKQAALGARHPDVAITLHNLARCCRQLGDAAGAERYLHDAVGILDGAVTDTEPTLVSCRRQLDELRRDGPPASRRPAGPVTGAGAR
jgi:Tfp pilus assembly protein PilF